MPYCTLLMLLLWIRFPLLPVPVLAVPTVALPEPMPISVVVLLFPATFRFLTVLLVAPSDPLLCSQMTAVLVPVAVRFTVRLRSLPVPFREPSIVIRSAAFRRMNPPVGAVVLVIVRQSTLYNGIRHLLFIYPVLVVLATGAWTAWLSADRRWIRGAAAAVLAVGLIDVITFDVRAYPNQTVYFNQLVGGPKGAFAKYETDYWGNCVLQAIDWTAQEATRTGAPVPISGDLLPELIGTDAQRFHEVFVTPPNRAAA